MSPSDIVCRRTSTANTVVIGTENRSARNGTSGTRQPESAPPESFAALADLTINDRCPSKVDRPPIQHVARLMYRPPEVPCSAWACLGNPVCTVPVRRSTLPRLTLSKSVRTGAESHLDPSGSKRRTPPLVSRTTLSRLLRNKLLKARGRWRLLVIEVMARWQGALVPVKTTQRSRIHPVSGQ